MVTTSILPPTLVADEIPAAEDTLVDIAFDTLTGNDTDPDGDPLVIDSVSNAVNGVVELTDEGVRFTPDENFFGEASLDYQVTKTNGLGATAQVRLAISSVDDAPVVTVIAGDQNISPGRPFVINVPDGVFTDADGDDLTYSATLADGSALPSWLGYSSSGVNDPGFFSGRLTDRVGVAVC